MIEDTLWHRYDSDTQLQLKQALVLLAKSGILVNQAQLERSRLLDGDPSQPVEEVAKEILRVRADTRGLELLHHYGLQLTQELRSEISNESA